MPNYITNNIAITDEMYDRDTGLSNSHDVNILPLNSYELKRRFVYNDNVI